MATLRRECPWDREQTHESLAPYLLQEAYETLETIEERDFAQLHEELGDVLLQVVFHSVVASERAEDDPARFSVDDVADAIIDKMTRRHPHVFGGVDAADADEVRANWEEIKAAERAEKARANGEDGRTSVLGGVPFAQPAMLLARSCKNARSATGCPPIWSVTTGTRAVGCSPRWLPSGHGDVTPRPICVRRPDVSTLVCARSRRPPTPMAVILVT